MRVLTVGLVCVAGAVLGWDSATLTHSSDQQGHVKTVKTVFWHDTVVRASSSSTVVVVPLRSVLSDDGQRAEEMERLAARNRRLEALVKVLRTREPARQP